MALAPRLSCQSVRPLAALAGTTRALDSRRSNRWTGSGTMSASSNDSIDHVVDGMDDAAEIIDSRRAAATDSEAPPLRSAPGWIGRIEVSHACAGSRAGNDVTP